MLFDIADLFGFWFRMIPFLGHPLFLLTLPIAVYLYLYYDYKKRLDDFRLDIGNVVRHLSKMPYQEKFNDNACISLLKRSKISPNLCTMLPHKTSLFLLACFRGSLKVIDFMLHHGKFASAKFSVPLFTSGKLLGRKFKSRDWVVQRGADPHQTNQHGDGAFYFAVYGIICRLKCSSRRIPRSTVIQQGVLLIDTLSNLGCNINLTNKANFTPLHWAIISKEQWLVSQLLLRGAVIDV